MVEFFNHIKKHQTHHKYVVVCILAIERCSSFLFWINFVNRRIFFFFHSQIKTLSMYIRLINWTRKVLRNINLKIQQQWNGRHTILAYNQKQTKNIRNATSNVDGKEPKWTDRKKNKTQILASLTACDLVNGYTHTVHIVKWPKNILIIFKFMRSVWSMQLALWNAFY